jgi:hypothetical protein
MANKVAQTSVFLKTFANIHFLREFIITPLSSLINDKKMPPQGRHITGLADQMQEVKMFLILIEYIVD